MAAILVFLFGSKKIPEFTKGIMEAIQNLRRGFRDDESYNKKKS